jgi:hypothetical protein
MAAKMLSRLIVSGAVILLACASTPMQAQVVRDPRAPLPATSFWSWSAVSAFGDIGRFLMGNWSCSGVYADGPTLESCSALTTVQVRRKRITDGRVNDTSE